MRKKGRVRKRQIIRINKIIKKRDRMRVKNTKKKLEDTRQED